MLVGPKSYFFSIILYAWAVVKSLWFYVVAGAAIAALAGTFLPRHRPLAIRKSRRLPAVVVASLVGMISPACTYGTVPICVELLQRGTPIGPIIAFLASSSIITPQIWLMTLGALGPYIAGAQIAAALAASVIAGLIFQKMQDRGSKLLTGEVESKLAEPSDESMSHIHGGHRPRPWYLRFGTRFLDVLEFMGLYFVLGALAAAALAHIPAAGNVVSAMGKGRWYAIPLATVTSVPVYVCGGATVLLLMQAASLGMAQGAILAFMVSGPATRLTSLAALAAVMRKRAVLLYVALVIVVAMIAGFAFAAWNPPFTTRQPGSLLTP